MRVFPLLKKVARSFYLTIWWLPSRLQKPVALAYLLARVSDTIADEGLLSFSERQKVLVFLKLVVEGKAEVLFLWKKSEQWKKFSKKERKLIEQLPEMLQFLQSKKYSASEAGHIKEVWEAILDGQLMDLQYQRDQKNFSAEELEKYLYLVAGSVGEFLTKLMSDVSPAFATNSLETMESLAIDYGKGLQLVNMLRDFSSDQQQGRFYFSEKEREYYHAQANSCLQQGEAYVNALRPGRFKVACALPLLLGRKTLARIFHADSSRGAAQSASVFRKPQQNWDKISGLVLIKEQPNLERLKISRWVVWWTMFRALRFLF